jgi:acetyltransferase-like isoleucine patch superfamily enzyme
MNISTNAYQESLPDPHRLCIFGAGGSGREVAWMARQRGGEQRHVHINIGCTVSHDSRIDDFATLSPGSHISGHVHVGPDVFIGTGACIINGSEDEPLTIGAGAVVAAGACVTRPVEAGTMVAGVPAVTKR